MSETNILAEFREQMTREEFEIRDNPNLPRMVLKVGYATDPERLETLALSMILAVHQKVRIQRLNRELMVPTTTVLETRLSRARSGPKKM